MMTTHMPSRVDAIFHFAKTSPEIRKMLPEFERLLTEIEAQIELVKSTRAQPDRGWGEEHIAIARQLPLVTQEKPGIERLTYEYDYDGNLYTTFRNADGELVVEVGGVPGPVSYSR